MNNVYLVGDTAGYDRLGSTLSVTADNVSPRRSAAARSITFSAIGTNSLS